ncbi:hypothetical protein LC2W_2625 [Lacticaseibacillus paracasei]|nr:hypothetical protein LC2W_2625 [Lacticaseibacillus paracasei]
MLDDCAFFQKHSMRKLFQIRRFGTTGLLSSRQFRGDRFSIFTLT